MRAGKRVAVVLPFAASLASACAQSGNGAPTPGWPGDASTSDVAGNPGASGTDGGGLSDGEDVTETGTGGQDQDTGGPATGDGSTPDASGTCPAGQPCTSPNPCTMGVIQCSTGTAVCKAGANLPDGTACAAGSECQSGTCTACGAQGEVCCPGGACTASPQLCISAVASTCRTNVSPQCTCGTLYQGMQLQVGQQLDSCDGRFDLILQSDGNLVLYEGSTALWAANTVGSGAALATMQDDGNFVVYTSGGTAVFDTGTEGSGCGTFLAVQTDGNLVVYDGAGTAVWASGTGGH